MRVLVCGYRQWRDAARIRARLAELPPDAVLIHTDTGAVERLADRIGEDLGLSRARYPDASAQDLLDTGITLVLAFHDYLPGSRETKATVDAADQRGIPVEVVTSTPARERSR